jgi:hypothetical protein
VQIDGLEIAPKGRREQMNRILALGLIVSFVLIASGCQLFESDPGAPEEISTEPTTMTIDMDSPTGGLTETDESPAFGRPEEFSFMDSEADYADPVMSREQITNMEREHRVRIYRLRAVWGRMVNAAQDTSVTDCCTVDWSGGMHVAGGVIIIEKLIFFDYHDSVTRVDRSSIRWNSKTCPHIDGIQVKIIVPDPARTDTTAAEAAPGIEPEPHLVLKAGPYDRTFTLDELEALKIMEPVDRCNNYIAIGSHAVNPGCPHGYLVGRWMKAAEPDTIINPETGETRGIVLGHFRGIWVSETGRAAGHLRGFFGLNSQGEHKFFGKYISRSGCFRGIIVGDYGPDPAISVTDAATVGGWFSGNWYGKNHGLKGRLKGEWVTADAGQGYFKGLWGKICSNAL